MPLVTGALTTMLGALKTYIHETFKIEAFNNAQPASTSFVVGATATYGNVEYVSASIGARMSLTANVLLQIPAGNTIVLLRIAKGNSVGFGNDAIYHKTITPQVFEFAGTITITSATITLNDA